MTNVTDELDKLLSDVRQTIAENRLFIEKLVDEAVEDDSTLESDAKAVEEDFEEL